MNRASAFLLLFLPLVAAAQTPAPALRFSEEFRAADPRIGHSVLQAHSSVAGASPSGFLVVWTQENRLTARLVSPDGKPIGALIDLAATGAPREVLWDGTAWIVVASLAETGSIGLLRLSEDGAPEGEGWQTLTAGDYRASGADGAETILLTGAFGGPWRLARFDSRGRELVSRDVTGIHGFPISLGSDGGRTLIVWFLDGSDGQARGYATTLFDGAFDRITEPVGFLPADWGTGDVVVSSSGDSWLVMTTDLLAPAAVVLGPDGTPLAPPHAFGFRNAPRAAAWTGSEWLVILARYDEEQFGWATVRLGSGGSASAAAMFGERTRPILPYAQLLRGGDGFLAVLENSGVPAAAMLDASGTVRDAPVPLALSGRYLWSASVAAGDDVIAYAWSESDALGEKRGVLISRVARDGQRLDGEGIRIASPPDVSSRPRIASNGDRFLVVWLEFRNGHTSLFGRRVSSEGTILDAAPFEIAPAAGSWSVTSDGEGFLVAYTAADRQIYAAAVDAEGIVLNPGGTRISFTTTVAPQWMELWQLAPATTFDGDEYLVVWQERIQEPYRRTWGTPSEWRDSIWAARLSHSAILRDAVSIPIADPGRDRRYFRAPSVAAGNGLVAIAWVASEFPETDRVVHAETRGRDLEQIASASTPGDAAVVAPAFGAFVLATLTGETVSVRRLSASGDLVPVGESFAVSAETRVGVASSAAGVFVGYARRDDEAGGARSLFGRFVRSADRRRAVTRLEAARAGGVEFERW